MKVLLTGITGNLGFEIAQCLLQRGVEVVPLVRNTLSLKALGFPFLSAIELDLADNIVQINTRGVDCIIHCAGNVHLEKSGDCNSKMMRGVIRIATNQNIPVYHISTAFLWREPGSKELPRNAYEKDKRQAEGLLRDSGIPHTIFRPSVLVGNSTSGSLIHWTGYYLLVSKFLEATQTPGAMQLRFPRLPGNSNMVPVDQAAEVISDAVVCNRLNALMYVTNPEPPSAQWVLDTTLDFFGITDKFKFLAMNFGDFESLQKTSGEDVLHVAGKHFSPYWSLSYSFPKSACKQNLITEEYLQKTLRSYRDVNNRTLL